MIKDPMPSSDITIATVDMNSEKSTKTVVSWMNKFIGRLNTSDKKVVNS